MKKLGTLKAGTVGTIRSVGANAQSEEQKELACRLLEMGLIEGERIELLHQAPFGGDPIAVRVRGAVVGIGRNEANEIEIEIDEIEMREQR